jgi:3,5-epimerase/4-reductase
MKILIFGHGYLGQRCHGAWKDSVLTDVHVTSEESALAEIQRHQPDVVFSAVGVKGKPNVDWCDAHPYETVQGNVLVPLLLAQACAKAGVYLLHLGSGCIFYGDSPHPDHAWRENDFGNPLPVYSRSKWAADLVLSTMPNVGIARLRMPIDHIPSSGNLIDKVSSFSKVIDVENSVTIIDDLMSVCHQLLERQLPGLFHATNPGIMKHRDLIELYRDLVNPSHTCEWISNNDLVVQGIVSKTRSNNILTSDRLIQAGIVMRPVSEALRDTMEKYARARRGEMISCEFCS